MKSQRISQRVLIPAAMAAAGAIMVIVSLPSWLLFTVIGAGLLAGAYLVYQHGL